ncbi:hypothetical protein GGE16_001499 [Rhizobium leguminosarum]|uniref:Uncharacterized protein n=1 Tax=Rhizobium leguminosarum TaxID=384 RepID=A0AAE2SW57_RHILE|nr:MULTISPECIES: hypothetical protein [Rhizobium]MBB4289483.1 hypothetical protein [Rhizobium leguminosarum]MBB4294421.1 hypothetical protein [Rhizobium leguminosarum]MBB4305817.1 hypothetical protein [Rhizobium leguminosarum]MBB4418606.1 hypothetical protein [Rhizobium leguminosarum]MBB4433450.1 hypothetical protein [Rhizobium esperanzae]
MRFVATLYCALLSASLSSCSTTPTSIDQTFTATRVAAYSTSSTAILNALSADAGYAKDSVSFYDITESGFNFVDSQCNSYFQTLHDLEHRRSATQQGLGAFGQTTNAILAVTGASAVSIAVAAQAFGLGQNLVNVYADNFLFSLPPSKTEQFVSKIMTAYRNAAAAHQSSINSGPAAYREIQGYLKLCTPVTIEAMLTDHIADATAEAIYGPGSTDIVTGTRTSAWQKAASDRTAPIQSVNVKLAGPTSGPKPRTDVGGINDDERATPPRELRNIQEMVCVQPTGRWDDQTRTAIARLFEALGDRRPRITTFGVTKTEITTLQVGTKLSQPLKCGPNRKNVGDVKYTTVEELATHLK